MATPTLALELHETCAVSPSLTSNLSTEEAAEEGQQLNDCRVDDGGSVAGGSQALRPLWLHRYLSQLTCVLQPVCHAATWWQSCC